MPNIDFYAVETDLLSVLGYVFERSGCRVFESYSAFGEEITEFKSIDDLAARYPIGVCRGTAPSVLLELVPPSAENLFDVSYVPLSPDACQGHTFRFAVRGWGLIQLHLGGIGPTGLVLSHTNHNTEARARKWQHTYKEGSPAHLWNWQETTRISSALNRFIRTKLAVYKIGTHPVLSAAASAFSSGVKPVSATDQVLLEQRRQPASSLLG
jgi:hypothetical protein